MGLVTFLMRRMTLRHKNRWRIERLLRRDVVQICGLQDICLISNIDPENEKSLLLPELASSPHLLSEQLTWEGTVLQGGANLAS